MVMAAEAQQTVLRLEPRGDFVLTPVIEGLCHRAMSYLQAGFACHLQGSAGTGKTTLAMHIARQRGRPVVLLFGDEDFGSSDLVGSEKGHHSKKVVDNFVHKTGEPQEDRKSTRLNSSHTVISYAVFCLKKKKIKK